MQDYFRSIIKLLLPAVVAILCLSGCGKRSSVSVLVDVTVTPFPGQTLSAATLKSGEQALRNRASVLGVNPTDVAVVRKGNKFTIDIPGETDVARVRKLYQMPGRLEFFYLKDVNSRFMDGRNHSPIWIMKVSGDSYSFTDARKPGSGPIANPLEIRRQVIGARTQPILTDKDLVRVKAQAQGSNSLIALTFTPQAQQQLAQFTRTHIMEYLAITLDNKILTAPIIRQAIPGNPVISGNFTQAQAQDMADILNAGELPFQPKITSIYRTTTQHIP
jgi:SecD/SecF fusion protein